jgi:hypothetical protein
VLASEVRDSLDEKINEFGDFEVCMADALQPEWRIPVADIVVELGDTDRFTIVSD